MFPGVVRPAGLPTIRGGVNLRLDMRKTRQRDSIRRAFERAARPISPAECLELAGDDVPGLGVATVYRNIRRLVDEGWLHVVELPGEPDRYELAGKHHHHHFQCRVCDGVFDVKACPGGFSEMTPEGFQLESHEIILYGTCANCTS